MLHEDQLLTKGLEEEVYTGTFAGDVVGKSAEIAADLPHFSCEPDNRNAEYATLPHRSYQNLRQEILIFRCHLRRYLKEQGNLTLLPGASLSLGDSSVFMRSDPSNPYHQEIEDKYGTDVVTTSAHINIGIPDSEKMMRAYRVLRCEAFAWLALTASSPFIDNELTGYHSWRWQIFPHTPKRVPLFPDQAAYIKYVEEQIEKKVMHNVRHLWTAVRPNGVGAPYDVQRLELRICDRVDSFELLLAVTALMEARIWQILEDPSIDPLQQSTMTETKLQDLIEINEQSVCKNSLDAYIYDWRDGQKWIARDWIKASIQDLYTTAAEHGFDSFFSPLHEVLEDGNTAMRWIKKYHEGVTIRNIIQHDILEMNRVEREHYSCCHD